jgi:long-chain acyl-CoA synthetase
MGFRPAVEDGFGPYNFFTYNEIQARIDNYGSGMVHLELASLDEEVNQRRIGHYSKNRMEWVIAEQACNAYKHVVVPLYDTLGPEAVSYVVRQADLRTVLCSAEMVGNVANVKGDCPALENIVQMEDVTDEELRAQLKEQGITLYSMAEVEAAGAANPMPHDPPSPDDVATFCYTSGTTGDPKGAMLTHGNIVADMAGAMAMGVVTSPEDAHLSYLPLAHMFERVVQAAIWCNGGSVGFYQGNTLKITEDIKALQPTIFPSVPRLYNKIYDKVMAGVAAKGGLSASLFNKGLDAKMYWLERGYYEYGFWDSLVFNGLREKMVRQSVALELVVFNVFV